MRLLLCLALLIGSVLVLQGCTVPNGPVMASIMYNQKGPVAGFENFTATKVGEATSTGVILVGYGDASIDKAVLNGSIQKIHHVDCETFNIFGVYSTFTTVVYGE